MPGAIQVRTVAGDHRETVERVVAALPRELAPGEPIGATDIRIRMSGGDAGTDHVGTLVCQFALPAPDWPGPARAGDGARAVPGDRRAPAGRDPAALPGV